MNTRQGESRVNLGCGSRHHPDWINIDIIPQGPGVIKGDLSRGVPLPDASSDVVYHSAVLEHMRRTHATAFLAECFRILKPGGILRVGVPDLERICHLYLARLDAVLKGDSSAEHDYDWLMLELLDQTVREKSGGEMMDFLQQVPIPNEAFVYERIGEEGREVVDALKHRSVGDDSMSVRNIVHDLNWRLKSLSAIVRDSLPRIALSARDKRALAIGRFRLAGEVHQWMYDRYSLARLLSRVGFGEARQQTATTSLIPDWTGYHLDTTPEGRVIKPDLLFMEAVKPVFATP